MDHVELVDIAIRASSDVFSDDTVSRENIKESLKAIVEHIDIMLDAL